MTGIGSGRRQKVTTRGKAVNGRLERVPPKADRIEQSAGGVVFKRTPRGLRLAMLLDPYGKWTFAKGHVEEGETVEQAALRETREEMGLRRLRIVRPLGEIDFWFRDRYRDETRGRLIHKYVRYFLMQAPTQAWGKPQRNEQIRRLGWFSLTEAQRLSGYRDVRPIWREVDRHFGQSDEQRKRHGAALPSSGSSARRPVRSNGRLKPKNETLVRTRSV